LFSGKSSEAKERLLKIFKMGLFLYKDRLQGL
jgi:hypothetical protein